MNSRSHLAGVRWGLGCAAVCAVIALVGGCGGKSKSEEQTEGDPFAVVGVGMTGAPINPPLSLGADVGPLAAAGWVGDDPPNWQENEFGLVVLDIWADW